MCSKNYAQGEEGGEAPPGGSNPYPLQCNILIFPKMAPLSFGYSKSAILYYTLRINQNNVIYYNCNVFPGFSVLLIQLRSHSAKMWHPLLYFHFAAGFVSLWYTTMEIFPTLLYTSSLKRHSFWAEPPCIAPLTPELG